MKVDSPIYTRIVNHYDRDKVLSWAGTYPIFVPANGEATVDFDIWSRATEGQKICMRTELPLGKIELYVGVKGPGGYSETLLDIKGKNNDIVFRNVGYVDTYDLYEEKKEEAPFATSLTTVPEDPVPEYETTTNVDPGTTVTMVIPANPMDDAVISAKAEFDAHVAKKEWADALKTLKSIYGNKVTFGPRSVMTSKSWDALVVKYNLFLED